MESPRIHGGGSEEKSSCESGWTMYIEDTFHGNHHSEVAYEEYDDDGDDADNDNHVKEVDDDGEDGDDDSSGNGSDDSMTSDASSWPSTQLPRNTKNHAAAKKRNDKQVNRQTKNSDEEEESEFKARTRTTTASRIQSRGGKASKTK